jgi:hypothetical protein
MMNHDDDDDDGTVGEALAPVEVPGERRERYARHLAAENLRAARAGGLHGIEALDHAAGTLSRLCAVYALSETDRCRREAWAHARAFQLLHGTTYRLARRRADDAAVLAAVARGATS